MPRRAGIGGVALRSLQRRGLRLSSARRGHPRPSRGGHGEPLPAARRRM